MNEVIASILEAERKADEIIDQSVIKSDKIRQTADEEGEKIKNSAVAVFKLNRASALKNAEKTASDEYDAIIERGKAQAEEIEKRAADKINSAAEEIVADILK
ncbi:MAG: hypothetical protein IJU83_03150 [Clostridia bacterium]|nr:hypothetical protein [Clostridia bacterium]